MKFNALLAWLTLLPLTLAAPPPPCKKPLVRKEWRSLAIKERKDYIRAVQCLHAKPGLLGGIYTGIDKTSRFEDFGLVHKLKTPKSHLTAFFLPWHRLFLAEYEYALRKECGYKGAQPYWDYTIDTATGNFTTSIIFNKDHGFGGNGPYTGYPALPPWDRWGGGCVDNGPFAGWKFGIAPGGDYYPVERCLVRNLNLEVASFATQDWENIILNQTSFLDMNLWLEGTPGKQVTIHAAGHGIVGGAARTNGTGAEVWTSNLEPMFYVHHTNLDRIWWEWQNSNAGYKWAIGGNLESRVPNQYGNDTANGVFGGPMRYTHEVDLAGVPGNYVKARIGGLLSTTGETNPNSGHKSSLCYVYEKSPKA